MREEHGLAKLVDVYSFHADISQEKEIFPYNDLYAQCWFA